MDTQSLPLLSVQNLSVTQSHGPLLKNLSFSLREGDRVGLIGANGVGKTTLLNCLAGMHPLEEGDVTIQDVSLFTHPDIKRNLGYLPDSVPLYEHLTVKQNLSWFARFRGLSAKEIKIKVVETLELFQITEFASILFKHLSRGERRIVGIASTVLHQPKVILLDEPTNDLDTHKRSYVFEALKSLSNDCCILIATHHKKDILELCNKVLLLENKQIQWVPKQFDNTTLFSEIILAKEEMLVDVKSATDAIYFNRS